jgi:hypothetical protein
MPATNQTVRLTNLLYVVNVDGDEELQNINNRITKNQDNIKQFNQNLLAENVSLLENQNALISKYVELYQTFPPSA